MPLVLSTVNGDNLNTLTNIFESLYTQFKLHGDMEMLKFIKEILAKLRTEQEFKLKKVKGSGLTIPSFNELKLKGGNINEMRRKIRLQVISDAMAKNGVELARFAEKVDILPQEAPKADQDHAPTNKESISITELAMATDVISHPQRLRQLAELGKKRLIQKKMNKEAEAVSVTELAMRADTLSNPLALRKLVEESEEDEQ